MEKLYIGGDIVKNIYLIGDSIRFGSVGGKGSPGYGKYVKEQLNGIYNVYAPNENCRFAQYTLRGLYDWINMVNPEEIDIIHWNNGLWDVMRLDGDEPLTPLNVYIDFLRRIHKKLQLLFPKAKIIFATSTPVIEGGAGKRWVRYNSEIEEYNAKATELMKELGVVVNDLYSVAQKFDESYYADWVHFNEKGAKLLANEVINKIKEVI